MAAFSVLIGQRYAEYRLGFQYGTLARELVNRHGYDAFEAKTCCRSISSASDPAARSPSSAPSAQLYRRRLGDMTVACFAAAVR